jgi:Leucine Rich Repeat.
LPNLPNLEVLNASYNCLISMPKAFFHVLELVLSHNSLTNLPNGMKNLEILDISYNKFEKLDFLTSSVNLKVLNACYNNFSNPELLTKKNKKLPFGRNKPYRVIFFSQRRRKLLSSISKS